MDQSTLISVSLAVYVTASVYVAAVRWGHRCAPYAKHMDYYYPAWKTVVFCYLANLFMLPALFMPTDADALLQLRLLLILASPFFCAVLMFSYFGKVLKITAWRRPVYILAVPFGASRKRTTPTPTTFPANMPPALSGLPLRTFSSAGRVLLLREPLPPFPCCPAAGGTSRLAAKRRYSRFRLCLPHHLL